MTTTRTCTSFAGDFDGHGNAPVQYRAHWPMRCAQRFNLSHWTPQLVRYLLRISQATARIQYKLLIANECITLAGNFNGHGNAPVRYQVHWHMRCSQHFNFSHWTIQLVEYLLRIAPATARVPYKNKQKRQSKQTHLTFWQFWWPLRCTSTVPIASTHALCSAL